MKAGVLALKGKIKLQSPAIIGCGEDENTDIDVIKDSQGKPFIPATSFVGVIKNSIKPSGISLDKVWGYTKETVSEQSALKCDDLELSSPDVNIEIRDGIKINSKTGMVAEGAKYDYEIIPAGTEFSLNMEASYKKDDKESLSQMLKTIEHYLSNGSVSIGAKTNCGLGRVILTDAKIYDFDFSKKPAVYYWLTKQYDDSLIKTDIKPFNLSSKDLTINAILRLKTSLIVRSYSADPEAPDAVHIKSGKDCILPGTSLKGAIRARAERIVNTIKGNSALIEDLFGYAYDDEKEAKEKGKKKGDAKKGRISIDEAILPDFISELQTRIKIDRFTGGTIEAALFETMPLFSSKDEKLISIKIHIKDYQDYEAGLMLLVLKDLWTGDLAVGGEKNIGRGVFEGIKAEIILDGKRIIIDKDLHSLKHENKDLEELERLVTSFVNYSGG